MCNDLAEAMKALDGKKNRTFSAHQKCRISMNTDVKCSIIEASSNELLYQIEVHNGLIPAYIVKKHDGPTPYIHRSLPSLPCGNCSFLFWLGSGGSSWVFFVLFGYCFHCHCVLLYSLNHLCSISYLTAYTTYRTEPIGRTRK